MKEHGWGQAGINIARLRTANSAAAAFTALHFMRSDCPLALHGALSWLGPDLATYSSCTAALMWLAISASCRGARREQLRGRGGSLHAAAAGRGHTHAARLFYRHAGRVYMGDGCSLAKRQLAPRAASRSGTMHRVKEHWVRAHRGPRLPRTSAQRG